MKDAVHFRVPTQDESQHIRASLSRFNQARGAPYDTQVLELALHDEKGQLLGAVLGWTLWSWFHIDSLWIEEAQRGRGLGAKLLREAEGLAQARGCEIADVDTFNFQALDFYLKQGYERFGELSGIGAGTMTRYHLKKRLVPS